MRASRLAFLAAAVAVVGTVPTASCSSPTEVVVVIDGDVADADAIAVRVESAGGFSKEKTGAPADMPLTLGVNAGSDESKSFTVHATALRGTDVLVSRTVRARLVSGESHVLVVSLCAACAGRICEADTTCGASGTCEAILEETDLPAWNGTPPPHACGSAGSGDGGIEGGSRVTLDDTYYLIDDPRNWTALDLTTMDSGFAGYAGAAFDGAFLYLSPHVNSGGFHGRVARYDTGKAFTDKTSWTAFDLTTLDPAAKGYGGAATFASDFVYFTPNGNGNDVVARYRVGASFTEATSWSTLHLSTHAPTSGAAVLGGAVVNFSHVWMTSRVPGNPFVLHDNRLTNDPIDAGWSKVNPQTVDAGGVVVPGNYFGGAFDLSSKMYFAPSGGHGIALMRDINAASGDPATGWFGFDLTTVAAGARGYSGAVFDGRYVTFVPSVNASGVHGFAARVDTAKPFDVASSWEIFDMTTVRPELWGFIGGVYDGRFVYFVPAVTGQPRVWIARYDTTAGFKDAKAWSFFDVKTLPGMAAAPDAFHGAAFDGKYIYLVPFGKSPMLRFEARAKADKGASKANGSFL
jgi:hypothetical protein